MRLNFGRLNQVRGSISDLKINSSLRNSASYNVFKNSISKFLRPSQNKTKFSNVTTKRNQISNEIKTWS